MRPDNLPWWPESEQNPAVRAWGDDPKQGWCTLNITGDRFLRYRNGYKVASACFLYDGTVEPLDAPRVQVSKLYDIRPGSMEMIALWEPEFLQYLERKHASGLTHVVLLVPLGVSTGQFSTLRQARALGIKTIAAGVGVVGTTFGPI